MRIPDERTSLEARHTAARYPRAALGLLWRHLEDALSPVAPWDIELGRAVQGVAPVSRTRSVVAGHLHAMSDSTETDSAVAALDAVRLLVAGKELSGVRTVVTVTGSAQSTAWLPDLSSWHPRSPRKGAAATSRQAQPHQPAQASTLPTPSHGQDSEAGPYQRAPTNRPACPSAACRARTAPTARRPRPQSDTAGPTSSSEPATPPLSGPSTQPTPPPHHGEFGPLAAAGHTLVEAVAKGNPPLQASADASGFALRGPAARAACPRPRLRPQRGLRQPAPRNQEVPMTPDRSVTSPTSTKKRPGSPQVPPGPAPTVTRPAWPASKPTVSSAKKPNFAYAASSARSRPN